MSMKKVFDSLEQLKNALQATPTLVGPLKSARELVDNFKEWRLSEGLSIRKASTLLDITPQYLSILENSTDEPNISYALGCRLYAFWGVNDEQSA